MKKIIVPAFLVASLFTTATSGFAAQGSTTITITPPENSISSIGTLVSSGITAVIVIAGLMTFVYLVWGGIEWLTSGGDKSKYEAARDRITAALIGLAIVSAAWAIMQLISFFFGIDITKLQFKSAADKSGSHFCPSPTTWDGVQCK
jgi:hypothetical protein